MIVQDISLEWIPVEKRFWNMLYLQCPKHYKGIVMLILIQICLNANTNIFCEEMEITLIIKNQKQNQNLNLKTWY